MVNGNFQLQINNWVVIVIITWNYTDGCCDFLVQQSLMAGLKVKQFHPEHLNKFKIQLNVGMKWCLYLLVSKEPSDSLCIRSRLTSSFNNSGNSKKTMFPFCLVLSLAHILHILRTHEQILGIGFQVFQQFASTFKHRTTSWYFWF